MQTMTYKGYTGSLEYSPQDKCHYGRVLGMGHVAITYEGETATAARTDFRGAVDDYLALCERRGERPCRPVSMLRVRLTPDMHSRVADMARRSGTTITAFVSKALERALSTTL